MTFEQNVLQRKPIRHKKERKNQLNSKLRLYSKHCLSTKNNLMA